MVGNKVEICEKKIDSYLNKLNEIINNFSFVDFCSELSNKDKHKKGNGRIQINNYSLKNDQELNALNHNVKESGNKLSDLPCDPDQHQSHVPPVHNI